MIIVFTFKKHQNIYFKIKNINHSLVLLLLLLLLLLLFCDTKQAKNHCNKHKHTPLGRRE
jgi:hypothetical protein